jgi:hypothetical protein
MRNEMIIDGSIAVLLAAVMGITSIILSGFLHPVLFGLNGIDFWFQADIARTHYNMIDTNFSNYRSNVHPLFALVGYYSTFIVHKVFNLSLETNLVHAVRLVISLVAALWLAALYVLLRLLSLHRTDAVIFTLIGACSSASIFWFSVPETYSFGSLSILTALIVAAVTQYRTVAEGWFVAASIASLSFTVTNWMAGLVATFVNLNKWKAIRATFIVLVVVCLLWWIEKQIFPTSGFFLNNNQESNFFFRKETGGPIRILLSFFSTSMVMPSIELVEKIGKPDWKILTVQHSWPWSGGILGATAAFSWMVLLCIGFWNLFFGSRPPRIRLTIGIILFGQLTLHMIYGEETFLYALHYLPLLLVTTSLGALSEFRKIVLVFAMILLFTGGLNNVLKFHDARDYMIQNFSLAQVKSNQH